MLIVEERGGVFVLMYVIVKLYLFVVFLLSGSCEMIMYLEEGIFWSLNFWLDIE